MATIEIELNPTAATAYLQASDDVQQKIQLLLNTLLPAFTRSSLPPIGEIMNLMSREARANGLTDEILADLLRDDN